MSMAGDASNRMQMRGNCYLGSSSIVFHTFNCLDRFIDTKTRYVVAKSGRVGRVLPSIFEAYFASLSNFQSQ